MRCKRPANNVGLLDLAGLLWRRHTGVRQLGPARTVAGSGKLRFDVLRGPRSVADHPQHERLLLQTPHAACSPSTFNSGQRFAALGRGIEDGQIVLRIRLTHGSCFLEELFGLDYSIRASPSTSFNGAPGPREIPIYPGSDPVQLAERVLACSGLQLIRLSRVLSGSSGIALRLLPFQARASLVRQPVRIARAWQKHASNREK